MHIYIYIYVYIYIYIYICTACGCTAAEEPVKKSTTEKASEFAGKARWYRAAGVCAL